MLRRLRGGKRQVTYDGHPLYFYVDDAPGRVLCHNVLEFGGLCSSSGPTAHPSADAAKMRSMFSNSRRSEAYCDSNSSSGMPGPWNMVKV